MCFQQPQAPNPAQVQSQELSTQLQLAPAMAGANATYSPIYSGITLENLSQFLNGATAMNMSYGATGKGKNYVPGGTISTPGNEGFLSMYQNEIMPTLTATQNTANTAVRSANMKDAATFAPQIIAGERAGNPGAANLLDQLTTTTGTELGYGTELTPAEKTQLNQSVRGGAAARGMGFGPSDVFNESMAQTGMGQSLLQQRMGSAESLVPELSSFYGNPFADISGMTQGGGMSAGNLGSLASGNVAPSMLSQFNPGSSMAALNSQQQFDASQAGAMNSNLFTSAPGTAASSY